MNRKALAVFSLVSLFLSVPALAGVHLGDAPPPPATPATGTLLTSEALPVDPSTGAGGSTFFSYSLNGTRERLSGLDAYQSSDFVVTGKNDLNIPGLSLAVENGRTYYFEARLFYDNHPTGGHSYGMDCTCAATDTRFLVRALDTFLSGFTIAAVLDQMGDEAGVADEFDGSGMVEIMGSFTATSDGVLFPTFSLADLGLTGPGIQSFVLAGSTFALREIE